MRLPDAFVDKMRMLLGDETQVYLDSLQDRPVRGLRVNTSKIAVSDFLDRSPFRLTPVPWTENGFIYDPACDTPSAHVYYHCGLYYLQEPSAMAPASFLPVQPGERVLDLCAAPGGKTTQLAMHLQRSGLLISNDISASRAKALIKNIELFGLKNTVVTCESPDRLAEQFPCYFDKILVDAPCSGEGMFRQGERMWRAWEEHGPAYFSPIQKDIILDAARMLRPGGYLLYSTCTFDPSEDEAVINYLIRTYPEFKLVDLPTVDRLVPGNGRLIQDPLDDFTKTRRFYPHRIDGEGHFVALLHKEGPADDRHERPAGTVVSERTVGKGKAARTIRMEIPADIADLTGVRFLRSGLTLGEVNHGKLVPSQAYAMTLRGNDYQPFLDLKSDDERAQRYLRGESLAVYATDDLKDRSDVLIGIDGFPVGWGKVQGARIKNKLLPGWRRQVG